VADAVVMWAACPKRLTIGPGMSVRVQFEWTPQWAVDYDVGGSWYGSRQTFASTFFAVTQ
jgi:hypothetical protein